MLAQARVCMLVKVRAVEIRQAMGIGGKVRRHPIQDHADPVLVAVIDEIHEVLRRAVAAGRREVTDGLIAPGFIQRMLHDGQQLDVREAHLADVVDQLFGEFAVAEQAVAFAASPGPEVNFVDGKRRLEELLLRARFHPCLVVPGITIDVMYDGSIVGPEFCIEGERVCLQAQIIVVALDLILVDLAFHKARNEQFPNTATSAHAHGMPAAVPVIEIPHHAHPLRVRSPHGKGHASNSLKLHHVSAEFLVRLVVFALA